MEISKYYGDKLRNVTKYCFSAGGREIGPVSLSLAEVHKLRSSFQLGFITSGVE